MKLFLVFNFQQIVYFVEDDDFAILYLRSCCKTARIPPIENKLKNKPYSTEWGLPEAVKIFCNRKEGLNSYQY